MTIDQARAKLISVAQAEIGYKEKKSNSQLDDPAANAGDRNYTKYARDIAQIPDFYNGNKQGYAWCDVFADWCFTVAFGAETGREMIYQGKRSYGAGTGWSARYYKDHKAYDQIPHPGDQIFFKTSTGTICHTGIVEAVSSESVTTIEGNSNNMVRRVTYPRSSSYIAGYGHPDYTLVADVDPGDDPASANHPTLRKGDKGTEVKLLQTKLLALGESLPKFGVDGEYGTETLKAVKSYQKRKGLEQDGIVGPLTWAAIDADCADLNDRPIGSPAQHDGERKYIEYVVKKGDTLTKVAIAHNTTAEALKIYNGIKNKNLITIGQTIKIPV